MSRATNPLCTVSEINLMAWVDVAEPGARLAYHRGFLALDMTPTLSTFARSEMERLRATADTAYRLSELGRVHLVQERLGPDRFAYLAIARPKPRLPRSAAIARLLEAA